MPDDDKPTRIGRIPGKVHQLGVGTDPPAAMASDGLAPDPLPGMLAVTITYIQMLSRPMLSLAPHRAEATAILRAENPTVSFYRFLYNTVGKPWLWYERREFGDEALRELITAVGVEIYVLYVRGVPAGYAELNRADHREVEIAYFGLMPDFIGRGLGPYFLDWTVGRAWQPAGETGPERVWLHTCTLDHPKALQTYQRAGFNVYDRHSVVIEDPRRRIAFD